MSNIKKFTHKIKCIITTSVICVCVLINTFQSYAKEFYSFSDFNPTSMSCILQDINSSVVLYKKNSTQKFQPGYLTKIMTAVLVLEEFSDLDQKFDFTYSAIMKSNNLNVEKIGAIAGDRLSLKDGLYSMFCTSANDVANSLAEYTAGNISDFVKLMNEKALNLGMKNTHFTNPTGIRDSEQWTTCEDLAILVSYALQMPLFSDMATVTTYTHAPLKRFSDKDNPNNTLIQTNQILRKTSKYYNNNITSAVFGGNKNIGYNFATSKNVNGLHLLYINLGESKLKSGYEEINTVFKKAFENYKSVNISEYDKSFPTDLGAMKIAGIYLNLPESLRISQKASVTLAPNMNFSELNKSISFSEKASNNKYSLGVVKYYYDKTFVGEASIESFSTKELKNIDISNLTSSGLIYSNKEKGKLPLLNITNNTSTPIYRDANGNIAISPAIIKVFVLLIGLIVFIFLFLIIRAKFYSYKRKKKLSYRK